MAAKILLPMEVESQPGTLRGQALQTMSITRVTCEGWKLEAIPRVLHYSQNPGPLTDCSMDGEGWNS